MLVHPGNPFRLDGYLTVLVGMGVPYEKTYSPPSAEEAIWLRYARSLKEQAQQGMDVREALDAIRSSSAVGANPKQSARQVTQ
jgi:phosphatidylserine/phosphatidylglycerophosphate/cardiolipin synthase-like enzyme